MHDEVIAEDASSTPEFASEGMNHREDELKHVNVVHEPLNTKSGVRIQTSTKCGAEVLMDDCVEHCRETQRPELRPTMFLEDSDEEDPNTYGEDASRPIEQPTSFFPPSIANPAEEDTNFQHLIVEHHHESASAKREDTSPQSLKLPESREDNQATQTLVKAEPQENRSLEQPSSRRQKKRPRLVPQVVVPTWASLQKREKEGLEKIKKMNNPKFKKTKDMEISLSAIYDRLKEVGLDSYPVTLDSKIRDRSVSRLFMSSTYGGGPQESFPQIGAQKLAQHGIKHFMYLNVENHSHAPQFVGNPGIFFDSEPAGNLDLIFYVFVRLQPSEWLYVGLYVLLPSHSLSKEEWKAMTEQVRSAWVRLIHKNNWGTGFRLRVAARRELGRQPTHAEMEQCWKDGKHKNVTPEDIRNALDSGTEALGVFLMKCVGYDEDFQRELVVRFSQWVPPPPKPKGHNKKPNAKSKKKPSPKGKRKREESSDSENPGPESEEDVKKDDDKHPGANSTRRSQRFEKAAKPEVHHIFELSDSEASDVHFVQPVSTRYRNTGSREDPIAL